MKNFKFLYLIVLISFQAGFAMEVPMGDASTARSVSAARQALSSLPATQRTHGQTDPLADILGVQSGNDFDGRAITAVTGIIEALSDKAFEFATPEFDEAIGFTMEARILQGYIKGGCTLDLAKIKGQLYLVVKSEKSGVPIIYKYSDGVLENMSTDTTAFKREYRAAKQIKLASIEANGEIKIASIKRPSNDTLINSEEFLKGMGDIDLIKNLNARHLEFQQKALSKIMSGLEERATLEKLVKDFVQAELSRGDSEKLDNNPDFSIFAEFVNGQEDPVRYLKVGSRTFKITVDGQHSFKFEQVPWTGKLRLAFKKFFFRGSFAKEVKLGTLNVGRDTNDPYRLIKSGDINKIGEGEHIDIPRVHLVEAM